MDHYAQQGCTNSGDSDGMAEEDRDLVLAEIYAKRPDIDPENGASA